MVNGLVKCCCGVGYGSCYIVIGIWGIIFLGIMGGLFMNGHQGNVGIEYKDEAERKKIGKTMLWTVLIYAILVILCSINVLYRIRHPWAEAVDPNASKRFSAIGPKNFEMTPLGKPEEEQPKNAVY
ncbi:hypothetical protein TVAG_401720 [Trichomonas vaginalis G3]|uniref:Transmembrane protein n=1 Tax=Trichomonas vaginalis (strain ATCC PRA-98 / G3) TaxID=412133 RepID=A2EGD8_TRIV3|nr:ribonuclease kappa family [Trichomonas vaginalis G3]EAY08317.1 hypothetical protein TVAG_401720 [Trichomonas vaginalis G3]KAI5546082.1 ribonuclease kappa family [Trichomonas vaginalis G3]|eukprot:XP_001320540.1 hypothetical protein [Trichomonas vaginalis G3]